MYRTPMSLKVDGKGRWDPAFATVGYPAKSGLHGTIHLPDSFAFGVSYKPVENLSIEVGAVYTLWSRFADFNIQMKEPLNYWNNNAKHWRNNWAFNLSAEWWATEWMALRLGYVFDKSPNNYGHGDYMMPSNGRKYYTAGIGFKWDKWTLDLAYMYAHNHEQNYTESAANDPLKGVVPGRTTHPHAHNFGIGIGYKF
jgi:long-chain fatty acid transport protein